VTDADSAVALSCQGVSHSFSSRNGPVEALGEISFTAKPHEFVCILGPSGCGKTTLLKIIAGLLRPTAGRVVFEENRQRGSPQSGLVFQEHGVFPWLNVLDNVAFGLEMRGVARPERRARAHAFVERVGLAAFENHYPHELSVGMQQRVGIARAFVSNIPILLMDEPFGSLDAQTKRGLQEELLRIWSQDRKLVLFVTHDIEEAALLGDRVLVMTGRPGRISEELTIQLERPRDPDRDRIAVSDLRWQIWQLLEADVRRGLSIQV
jgi:NitT/TauT family transport system ATP-binding protein